MGWLTWWRDPAVRRPAAPRPPPGEQGQGWRSVAWHLLHGGQPQVQGQHRLGHPQLHGTHPRVQVRAAGGTNSCPQLMFTRSSCFMFESCFALLSPYIILSEPFRRETLVSPCKHRIIQIIFNQNILLLLNFLGIAKCSAPCSGEASKPRPDKILTFTLPLSFKTIFARSCKPLPRIIQINFKQNMLFLCLCYHSKW